MRVLIAPDKFKDSLSATQVRSAISIGLLHAREKRGIDSHVAYCPIADGGEGFTRTLGCKHFDRITPIRDPLDRPVTAQYGWLDSHIPTAVIEMSDPAGLHRLTREERNPWHTSTFGVGQLIRHAAKQGAARIFVGLGGSATNDAGAGAASALGWQFLTSDGEPLDPRPSNFLAIERIQPPEDDTPLPPIIAACDVRNPLLGPDGASHTYARQKGADDRAISHLELALTHLADLITEQLSLDFRALPGAGAAGGLGYGLATFCNAQLQPGFRLVAEARDLESRIAASDLVITAEGRLDAQSLLGKAPVEVACLARKLNKPVAIICGQCDPGPHTDAFDLVIPLTSLESTPGLSFTNAAPLVSLAAIQIAEWAHDLPNSR
jgi:glycerate kinase